ncbi:MAG TPA: nitroreductase family protein, partial [Gaiellaceae bacterium]|nr:nitroreductase family protein [Gaiellaceae bacterium]
MDTYLAVASKRDWRSYADRPVPDDVQRRILDGGRLAGSAANRQPWTFVVVESAEAKERVAETVYAADNIRTCGFAVAIATEGGKAPLDVGRALQNMFL